MSANPSTNYIAGEGKPRLVLVLARQKGYIADIEAGSSGIVNSPLPHKLNNGISVRLSNTTAKKESSSVLTGDNYAFITSIGDWTGAGVSHNAGNETMEIASDAIASITLNLGSLGYGTYRVKFTLTKNGDGDLDTVKLVTNAGDNEFSGALDGSIWIGTVEVTEGTMTSVDLTIQGVSSASTIEIGNITLCQLVSVDGDYTATVIDRYSFSIPIEVITAGTLGNFEARTEIYESTGTTTYTATGITETGSPEYLNIKINARVLSYAQDIWGNDVPTFAKIIAKATGILTVDEWTNGTPTNGNQFRIDGHIVDLPRCEELTERIEPEYIKHELYNGDLGSRLETKFQGWRYYATLDYKTFLSADVLFNLGYCFKLKPDDQLILIPRIDQKGFQYNVIWDAPLELALRKNFGYKKVVLIFKGKENQGGLAMLDGYGTAYGTDYGDRL